jgi:hypothetical protein
MKKLADWEAAQKKINNNKILEKRVHHLECDLLC